MKQNKKIEYTNDCDEIDKQIIDLINNSEKAKTLNQLVYLFSKKYCLEMLKIRERIERLCEKVPGFTSKILETPVKVYGAEWMFEEK